MNELTIPNHVGIILDGNRRWAKERHLPTLEGHHQGFKNIRTLTKYIFSKGVKILTVYAFSTENFNRSAAEVKYLMDMFVKEFGTEYKKLHQNNIKIIFSGRQEPLREDVLKSMHEITEITKNNTGGIFNVCINYGSRAEIVDATKKIATLVSASKLKIEDINEELFSKYLYHNLPPIDLLIRTSGECRLSNFQGWQLAYAELYFPTCYWPDFNEHEFDQALIEFEHRHRRFGG